MNTAKAHKVVVASAILTFTIGTINSMARNGRWPSARFILGNGVIYFVLATLAEFEPEIASPLSIAVLTTAILGEGDGVLTYLNHRGELDTTDPKKSQTPAHPKDPHAHAKTRVVATPGHAKRRGVPLNPGSVLVPGIPSLITPETGSGE